MAERKNSDCILQFVVPIKRKISTCAKRNYEFPNGFTFTKAPTRFGEQLKLPDLARNLGSRSFCGKRIL